MDHDNVVRFADDARPITDDFNQMATQSARVMDSGNEIGITQLTKILSPFDPLLQPNSWLHQNFPVDLNFTYISRRLEGMYLKQRAISLADTLLELGDPESLIMIGLGQERQGETAESQRNLLRAIDADPSDQQARYALLESWLPRIARDDALPQRIKDEVAAVRGTAAAVMQAWIAASRGDIQRVSNLDTALAEVKSTDLWYLDAVKLRADWRIKVSNPEFQPRYAREATRLIDNAIAIYQDKDFYSLRLAAAYVADDVQNLVETARRMLYIFESEVAAAEGGDVSPERRSIIAKMRQVEAMRKILSNLQGDERIAAYKLANLESATNRVVERLGALLAISGN